MKFSNYAMNIEMPEHHNFGSPYAKYKNKFIINEYIF